MRKGAPEADSSETTVEPAARKQHLHRNKSFVIWLKKLGPGLITGASDHDPSGIGTYAIAGAQLGYAPLWTALITFPMMDAVQLICS